MKGDPIEAHIRLMRSLPVRTHEMRDEYERPMGGRPKGAVDFAPRPLKTDTPSKRALKNREKRAEHWRKTGEKSLTIPKL